MSVVARTFLLSCGGDGGGCERVEDGEAFDVGDGGGEEGLEFRFSSTPVAGLAHPEVLEVIDLSFDLGPLPQQLFGDRFNLGGPGGLDPGLVFADQDRASSFAADTAVA